MKRMKRTEAQIRALTLEPIALPVLGNLNGERHVCPVHGTRQTRRACALRFAKAATLRDVSTSKCLGCKEGRRNLVAAKAEVVR